MNGASRIETEALLVVSVALVVMPLLAAAVYLVRWCCRIRRRRPQSFLEVISDRKPGRLRLSRSPA